MKTASAGGVVVSRNGRVVVVGQATRSDSLPKGHVEPGETLLETAVREIYEETGLLVSGPLFEYPPYERASGHGSDEIKTIFMFLFVVDDEPSLRAIDPANSDPRWLDLSDAIEALTYVEDRGFLRAAATSIRDLFP